MIWLLYIVLVILLVLFWIYEKKIERKRSTLCKKFMQRIFKTREDGKLIRIFDKILSWIFLLGIVFVFQMFFIANLKVPTASMEPTIMIGEKFFGNMFITKFTKPKRGKIIIFREPVENRLKYTKRLVALAGDTIAIGDDGHLVINGISQKDSIIYAKDVENSLLGAKVWTIPKKGDKIFMKNGLFQLAYKDLDFEELKSYLLNNGGIPEKNVVIIPKEFEFSVNNKIYKQGLFSYITNMKESLELLSGNTIVKDGKSIKITKGEFQLTKDAVSSEELLKAYEKDKNIKFKLSKGEFILNDKLPTGPIYDREILLELIRGKEVLIENDYYFALGDNTNNSFDSRYFGFIKDKRIIGTLLVRYWPLNKIKLMINE